MRLIGAVFLLLISSSALAQNQGMLPITEVMKGTNLSKPDNSAIGFIGVRCGNLFTTISGYFAGNASNDSERQTAKNFMDKAEVFSFVGMYIDTNINKKTNDAVRAQSEALSKAYIDEMLAGKRLNNNIFTKLVEADVKFCASQLPSYEAMYRTIYASADNKRTPK